MDHEALLMEIAELARSNAGWRERALRAEAELAAHAAEHEREAPDADREA